VERAREHAHGRRPGVRGRRRRRGSVPRVRDHGARSGVSTDLQVRRSVPYIPTGPMTSQPRAPHDGAADADGVRVVAASGVGRVVRVFAVAAGVVTALALLAIVAIRLAPRADVPRAVASEPQVPDAPAAAPVPGGRAVSAPAPSALAPGTLIAAAERLSGPEAKKRVKEMQKDAPPGILD